LEIFPRLRPPKASINRSPEVRGGRDGGRKGGREGERTGHVWDIYGGVNGFVNCLLPSFDD
jgi:hypothetical protein